MYCITEQQIEYILNDIRRNGVEMEDLQLNLLDHICCIIEQELKEGDEFESFYQRTVRRFYKTELQEIEAEAILLLTYKNYYAMKKLMVYSGVFSAAAFIAGSFFKLMRWPGANMLLCLAIFAFALVFLPVLGLLKMKDNTGTSGNKTLIAMGCFVGILYTMSSLFAVQHWHGRSWLAFGTVAAMFLFIPVYFFMGIRRPERKLNTIVVSVLLVAATSLMFLMMRVKPSLPVQMYSYIQSEELLKNMQHAAKANGITEEPLMADIDRICEQTKTAILKYDIGQPTIPADYAQTKFFMFERDMNFQGNKEAYELLMQLKEKVNAYNATKTSKIPTQNSILDASSDKMDLYTNFSVLNTLVQIQMFLASEEINATHTSIAKN